MLKVGSMSAYVKRSEGVENTSEAAARCRTSASEAASRPSVVVGEKIWWGVGALFAIELALVSAVDG